MKIKHNTLGWMDGIPLVGDVYLVAHGGSIVDGVLTGHGSHTSIYTVPLDDKTEYTCINLAVTTEGSAAILSLSGDFIADIGDSIVVACDLDEGSLETYPGAVLKLPVTRYADDNPTDDEVYFNASIIDGTLTATGTLPRSGNWKIKSERVNRSLGRIGLSWILAQTSISILV